ncbi:ELC1 [Cyberlindnera jadinii]|uniref:Elongin-C n=1 Tax=Cyberlindnera jadinii (strain ATCC 18201 / CBS 1600 / BCRC 20928 / JCM 3617 / NBRC 0987 / NRRL Y-1542) TaxID=983966 RepID=A0A0H5C9J2_CYBJN|nr:transcription elongation factor B polypeptide 1 [Cyberlindnera jadinii NRRL Y-1542]ODV73902.1 transcription elongation factor B polypeptide 1 [Cyberlindnera jadinii NRRL Y-1542]CEP25070.1 ELC1 [Cyberlindnera jadinii]
MTQAMYITLVSSDNFEFIITSEAANVSGTLRSMLQSTFKETSERRIRLHEFDGRVLGKVVEYLYYNLKYKDSVDVPEFDIPEEMALELLDASDFLDV